MTINQFVTLYRIRRDEHGKIVEPRRKDKYSKAVRFDRPPMLYVEVSFSNGSKKNVPFERIGPDEYCEIIKETKK